MPPVLALIAVPAVALASLVADDPIGGRMNAAFAPPPASDGRAAFRALNRDPPT